MKSKKVWAALLSASLVVGAASMPAVTEAKAKKPEHRKHIDWGTINLDKLAQALIERGEIDADADAEEIEREVREYVLKREIPHGVDTSSSFGKRAEKGLKGVQEAAFKRAGKKGGKKKSSTHVDNIVLALIEFPDFPHNQLSQQEGWLWTADFSSEHYGQMLFNRDGYTTPEGLELTTMAQYYAEQSGGTWTVDGVVTPWIQAEHEAAYYGGNDPDHGYNDMAPRELVLETLEQVGDMIAGREDEFDQRDPYDLDGDQNTLEPDGLLDNLMIVHSGAGEEAGGGALGPDAIWSHRWTLRQPTEIPGTSLKAFDYMIQPEDGAVGVFAHEYGHNLGLPDLYDILGSGYGSPVGSWSVMSSGSWNGKILGTEPTGFDPWCKLVLQTLYGGNWIGPMEIDYEDIKKRSKKRYVLEEAVSDDPDRKVLKINLPDLEIDPPTQPYDGDYSFFSTKGDDLDTTLTTNEIDLTQAETATLKLATWRDIETGYDYLYVHVIDTATGEKTTVEAWDDSTDGEWVEETSDLSEFVGKKIQIQFNYKTDGGLALEGFYVDNIVVEADGQAVFSEDGEGQELQVTLDGFQHFDGSPIPAANYYLVEWRTHNGVDKGLANYRRGNTFFTYDPGMVVWYYDGRWGQMNDTGNHPGEGFLGVVDAHQRVHYWNGNLDTPASDRYQVLDAAFGFNETSGINIDYPPFGTLEYPPLPGVDTFYDKNDYTMPDLPDVGKILPKLGIHIQLKDDKGDRAVIEVTRK